MFQECTIPSNVKDSETYISCLLYVGFLVFACPKSKQKGQPRAMTVARGIYALS